MAKRNTRATNPEKPSDALWYMTAAVDFGKMNASAGGGEAAHPTFSMVAYTGGPMRLWGSREPVVVDLSGMDLGAASLPILVDHMPYAEYALGHTTEKTVDGGTLRVAGVISGVGDQRDKIVSLARNGFPWQASIGFVPQRVERVEAGQSANVNGRTVSGPVNVVRASKLREVSFVVLGADDATTSRVAASAIRGDEMPEVDTIDSGGNATATATANAVAAAAAAASATASAVDAMNREAAANFARIAGIQVACAAHPQIASKAILEGWTVEKAELESLRASRPAAGAPAAVVNDPQLGGDVLKAAAFLGLGIDPVKECGLEAKAADAAAKNFPGGLGLSELLLECARGNGYSRRSARGDETAMLRAAFSTAEISGILSTVANKVLLRSFTAVEQVWREIAAIRSVKDFKTVTGYRLNGSMEYEKVAPGGELKYAKATEESFTNAADTYGKMFGVTRQDLINDDLGALSQQAARLGRGAGLGLNKIFWTAFLDNASFFSSPNTISGAGSAFSIDGLAAAEKVFVEQVDADGHFVGALPSLVLVPPALSAKASTVYVSAEYRDVTTNKSATSNVFAQKYRPLTSAYIGTAGPSGGSNTAWYLLANPADVAVMEVVFLNGSQSPVIETAQADFDTLGISMRGYFDFGCAKQDKRGGIKNAGV